MLLRRTIRWAWLHVKQGDAQEGESRAAKAWPPDVARRLARTNAGLKAGATFKSYWRDTRDARLQDLARLKAAAT